MDRLTTNKAVSDMSTYELAHNCMVAKDRQAWYRDFDREISLRDLIREIAYGNNIALPVEDEEFDEELYACLQYDPADSIEGMLALLNMFAWAHADNSAKLKMYEDAEEQGLLLRLPCKVGTHIYIMHHYWIDEGTICGLAECDDIDCACFKVYEDPDTYTMVAFNEFGVTWFLSETEAEKALQEHYKTDKLNI